MEIYRIILIRRALGQGLGALHNAAVMMGLRKINNYFNYLATIATPGQA
jgi:hypothetical protein